jgi:hypothetical protein
MYVSGPAVIYETHGALVREFLNVDPSAERGFIVGGSWN